MSKNDSPCISVVIPAYNREKTIEYCLDSVVNQTYPPVEVIVVDDCSSDNTINVVNNYPDKRVRCVKLENNSGAQAARNRGIKEAKGNWIAFQDSDDSWASDKLEKQVDALKGLNFDPWVVVHTNAYWLDVPTGKLTLAKYPEVKGENVYSTLLNHAGPLFPTLLVSKVALEKIGFLDENVPSYQEWDTSIRLAKYCKFIFLREPLFIYHFHEGETISKNMKRDILGYQYILNKFEHEIKKVCGETVWNQKLISELKRCLDLEVWSEADFYFERIPSKNLKYRFMQISRYMRIPPKDLMKLAGPLKQFKAKAKRLLDYVSG